MPTVKNYNTTVIDICERMPDDEYLNVSLTVAKIIMMQGEYLKALTNGDIVYLNNQKRIDPEIVSQAKIVRQKSLTSATNQGDYNVMMMAYKRCAFRMMRIMQEYVLTWYYDKKTVSGRGRAAVDVSTAGKSGMATGRGTTSGKAT